jgi:hypothetical protein
LFGTGKGKTAADVKGKNVGAWAMVTAALVGIIVAD